MALQAVTTRRTSSRVIARLGGLVFAALLSLGANNSSAAQLSLRAHAQIETGGLAGESAEGLTIFKGIPFAAPPTGALRWRAPEPAASWEGVRDATAFAPACMQLKNPMIDLGAGAVSEDCLYLNVWTPAKSENEKLPVVVWIHGGGFSFGASSQKLFDGAELARKGVVFVSPTYRLGPLGFLAHPALSAESPHQVSGNYGILDQIAALQWVRRNIAAFGGDPEQVTIMGESAGAFSASILAASPLADGLFHRVIAESGASFGVANNDSAGGDNLKMLGAAEQQGQAWADKQGLRTASDLRNLPAEAVLQTMPRQSLFVLNSSWPVLDGHVIAEDAVERYTAGRQNDTPILVGWNADEGSLFIQKSSLDDYRSWVNKQFGNFAQSILYAYPADNDQQALVSRRNIFRDQSFGWPAWTWANLQTQTGNGAAYVYYFNQSPPAIPGRPDLGATHAMDMFYVFKNLMPIFDWTDGDRNVSETMSSYWINFIRTGNPNGMGLPEWQEWSINAPIAMHFENGACAAKPGVPNAPQMQAIDAHFKSLRQSPGDL